MEGISSKAAGKMENRRKFVSQEFNQDLGIELYEFKWRHHDPQLGRFIEIDPLADKYSYSSPYAYAENRPIDGIDLEGWEYERNVDVNTLKLSIVNKSTNNKSMVSNEFITTVNNEVKRQMANLFSKTDPETGTTYSADYSSEIVEPGSRDYNKTIVVDFYDQAGNFNGYNGSNTQSGRLVIGVTETITKIDALGNSSNITIIRDPKEIATTIIHELLHGAGAPHVYEPGAPPDIAQYNPDHTRSNISNETIRNNVMNSGGNPIPELKNTDGRNNLSLGQVKATDARVNSEREKSKNHNK